MIKKVGIIGYPLEHSLSPIFQQAAFDDLDINIVYESWPLKLEQIPNFVQDFKFHSVLGMNVTIPYKEIIIDYLDDIHMDALSVGAVNTVVNTAGTLVGYNTDISGFSNALDEFIDLDTKGKSALILGAGGVARAALRTLILKKFAKITIANRTEMRAIKIANEFKEDNNIDAINIYDKAVTNISNEAFLIVNCTSFGMLGNGSPGSFLESFDISEGSFVYDMVYNPLETPLMRIAAKSGAKTSNGLSMLIHQGAQAFKLWTGLDPNFDVMVEAAQQKMIKNLN